MAGRDFFRADVCLVDPYRAQKHCWQRLPARVDEKPWRNANFSCAWSSEIFASFVTGDFACSNFARCFPCAGFRRGRVASWQRATGGFASSLRETIRPAFA